MKRNQRGSGEILFAIFLVVFIIFGGLYLDSVSCKSKWEGSGFPSSWTFLGGCKIYVDDKWIPENNYREIPE